MHVRLPRQNIVQRLVAYTNLPITVQSSRLIVPKPKNYLFFHKFTIKIFSLFLFRLFWHRSIFDSGKTLQHTFLRWRSCVKKKLFRANPDNWSSWANFKNRPIWSHWTREFTDLQTAFTNLHCHVREVWSGFEFK